LADCRDLVIFVGRKKMEDGACGKLSLNIGDFRAIQNDVSKLEGL
jgi:hypothetical protein